MLVPYGGLQMSMSPTALYRYLLRCVALLPKEVQPHYKHHVRQGFKSHEDEDDPERIQQIMMRSKQDAHWLLKKVNYEIVAGLKYSQWTYRKGIRVDKSNYMVGSYGPKAEVQSWHTPYDEAPKGMLARGHYTLKSKFTDDDKHNILSWEWSFDIKKEWE